MSEADGPDFEKEYLRSSLELAQQDLETFRVARIKTRAHIEELSVYDNALGISIQTTAERIAVLQRQLFPPDPNQAPRGEPLPDMGKGLLHNEPEVEKSPLDLLRRNARELSTVDDERGYFLGVVADGVLRSDMSQFHEDFIENSEEFPAYPNEKRMYIGVKRKNIRLFFLDDGRFGFIGNSRMGRFGVICEDLGLSFPFVIQQGVVRIVPDKIVGRQLKNMEKRIREAESITFSLPNGDLFSVINPLYNFEAAGSHQ